MTNSAWDSKVDKYTTVKGCKDENHAPNKIFVNASSLPFNNVLPPPPPSLLDFFYFLPSLSYMNVCKIPIF